MVFAAASLKPAFTQIAGSSKPTIPAPRRFRLRGLLGAGDAADPGRDRRRLRIGGHRADGHGRQGRLTGRDPTNFASNTLVIVTAPGNPKKIESFADLAKPGLNVVICQQPVPCGSATQRIEDSTGVHLNPVSEEPA